LAGAGSLTRYDVSKAGINLLTQYVAVQQGKENICCNAIAPGLVVMPATTANYAAADGPGAITLKHHQTSRLGTPEDIAKVVLFLASDESEFINGQLICVDGGTSIVQPFNADMTDDMKQFTH